MIVLHGWRTNSEHEEGTTVTVSSAIAAATGLRELLEAGHVHFIVSVVGQDGRVRYSAVAEPDEDRDEHDQHGDHDGEERWQAEQQPVAEDEDPDDHHDALEDF